MFEYISVNVPEEIEAKELDLDQEMLGTKAISTISDKTSDVKHFTTGIDGKFATSGEMENRAHFMSNLIENLNNKTQRQTKKIDLFGQS
mmetsp:Transcript_19443/g.29893  ORF Transcript_19443/g.29893 Transcript_19443/m.29893 type:complete len:89 (+) Transcript_19443:3388-3654(+)